MPGIGEVFRIGVGILRTVRTGKTKAILAQLGSSTSEVTEVDNAEVWAHVGFVYRPPEAVAKGPAAEAISIRATSGDIIIATRDLRGLALAGELEPGEVCVYAPGRDGNGQGRMLMKADGSVHLYARKGNAPDGAGMTIQLDPNTGAIRLIDPHGNALISGPDGWVMTAGESSLTLARNGDATLVGTGQTQVDGAGILLGSVGIPGVDNAITGPAGIAGKPSPKVLIGSQ